MSLSRLDLVNRLNLVNKMGLTTKFTKLSLGCTYIGRYMYQAQQHTTNYIYIACCFYDMP